MVIWEVMCNNDYKNFTLINSNNEYVTDIATHFIEKQNDTSFLRKIQPLDDKPLGDIMNYISISGTFLINEKTKKF